MIKEYRKDGWPICPNCGKDELWSKLLWLGDSDRPPLADWIVAGLSCYCCGWSNEKPVITNLLQKINPEPIA